MPYYVGRKSPLMDGKVLLYLWELNEEEAEEMKGLVQLVHESYGDLVVQRDETSVMHEYHNTFLPLKRCIRDILRNCRAIKLNVPLGVAKEYKLGGISEGLPEGYF